VVTKIPKLQTKLCSDMVLRPQVCHHLCSAPGCVHNSVTTLRSFPKPSGTFEVSLLWPVWGQTWNSHGSGNER